MNKCYFIHKKISCFKNYRVSHFCHGSLIKDTFSFFFYFTIIISDPGKSYFKNWNNIPYSQRCFTFLSIFHLSRFGCTTSFSLSFNKPRENLNSRMKRYLTVSSIQYRYLFRIRGKRFHRFVPIFPPVKHREDGRRTRFEARNLAGSRIA